MYVYLSQYDIDHGFKTEDLEKMDAYVRMKAKDYGSGFRGGYATIDKIVATKEIDLEYAEVDAETFFKEVEQRKQDYKAIGASNHINDD